MFLIVLNALAIAGGTILIYFSIKSVMFLVGVINLILHLV